MEDNCFSVLCWFLPYDNVNHTHICPALLNLPSTLCPAPPTPTHSLHPSTLGCHRAQAELPGLYSDFPPAIFTRGSICMSMLLSQFVPASPVPAVSTSLLCLHLCSCSINRFINIIFLDSIYMCYYTTFVFL